eukprot:TRINITY_DN9032_c0_g3_i1.p1 TRINITY_DN9032_c0_g3~~TRINITY_DN9032_c0_g3_i1.p1  ORF type:complete len:894 (+),score=154.81 TRINITY_DN9032_c0_g3_i1:76-2757(+)
MSGRKTQQHDVSSDAEDDSLGCESQCPNCDATVDDDGMGSEDIGYFIGECDECGISGCTNCRPDLLMTVCEACELTACQECVHLGAPFPERELLDEDPNPIHTCSKCERSLCSNCIYMSIDDGEPEMATCSRCHCIVCLHCKSTGFAEAGILPSCYYCDQQFCTDCLATSTVVCYKANCNCAQRCVCDIACLDCREEACVNCGLTFSRQEAVAFRLKRKALAKEREQQHLAEPREGYIIPDCVPKVKGLDMHNHPNTSEARAAHIQRQQAQRDDGQLSGRAFMEAEAAADAAAADLLKEEEAEAERRAAKNRKRKKKKKSKKNSVDEGSAEAIDKNLMNGSHSNGVNGHGPTMIGHSGQPQPSSSQPSSSQSASFQPPATSARQPEPMSANTSVTASRPIAASADAQDSKDKTKAKSKKKSKSKSKPAESKSSTSRSQIPIDNTPSDLELKRQAQEQLDGAIELEDIRALEIAIATANMVDVKNHSAVKLLKRLKKAKALATTIEAAIVSNDEDVLFCAIESLSAASKRIIERLEDPIQRARLRLAKLNPHRLTAFDALFASKEDDEVATATSSVPTSSAATSANASVTVSREPSRNQSNDVPTHAHQPVKTIANKANHSDPANGSIAQPTIAPPHSQTIAAASPIANGNAIPQESVMNDTLSSTIAKDASHDHASVPETDAMEHTETADNFDHTTEFSPLITPPTNDLIQTVTTKHPKVDSVPDCMRLGWGVAGATPAQVQLLKFLQTLKLMHYKEALLARGITQQDLLTMSAQELMAVGIKSEIAVERIGKVRLLAEQNQPLIHKQTAAQGNCYFCFEAVANQTCLPCNHVVTCSSCISSLTCITCPMCRGAVQVSGLTACVSQQILVRFASVARFQAHAVRLQQFQANPA